MSILDKLDPYALVAKLVGLAIGIAAMFAFVTSWMARGQEIHRLKDWQATVVLVTTDAIVKPDAKGIRKPLAPEQVPAAIGSLDRSLASCSANVEIANSVALSAKAGQVLADKALANANVLLANDYSSSKKRIDALASAKPGATPDLQCQAIGADSKAAWEGWK
jgi:hypothetical protein